MQSSFTHPTLPVTIAGHGSSSSAQVHAAQVPHGSLVVAELKAAGTLFTVPANVTFTGVVSITAGGSGSVTVSAATGGQIAGTSGILNDAGSAVPVTVAGGGSGNAITVAASGNAGVNSVLLVGYVA